MQFMLEFSTNFFNEYNFVLTFKMETTNYGGSLGNGRGKFQCVVGGKVQKLGKWWREHGECLEGRGCVW